MLERAELIGCGHHISQFLRGMNVDLSQLAVQGRSRLSACLSKTLHRSGQSLTARVQCVLRSRAEPAALGSHALMLHIRDRLFRAPRKSCERVK